MIMIIKIILIHNKADLKLTKTVLRLDFLSP